MNKLISRLAALALACLGTAQAASGLVDLRSPLSPTATMDRLDGIVRQRGLTVFARIDHAAGAAQVGQTLRPTEVLIFGNPKGGTPFMQCAQSVGLDLPLKALVWQDAAGQVWLSYDDPLAIAKRHGVPNCEAAQALSKALAGLAAAAVAP